MPQRQISGRQLRHESPEETLSPGESLQINKRGGKVFELRRIDSGEKDILHGLDKLLAEMPDSKKGGSIDFSKIVIEDRE